MEKIREILVRELVLGTWVVLFGQPFHTLRAARVLFPWTVGTAIIVIGNPLTWDLFLYDYIALGGLFLVYWLGLGNFRWTYFGMFPAKYEELKTDEQKYDMLRAIQSGVAKNPWSDDKYGPLPDYMLMEMRALSDRIRVQYKGNFAGLKNLVPLALSLLAIAIWFIYWQTHG